MAQSPKNPAVTAQHVDAVLAHLGYDPATVHELGRGEVSVALEVPGRDGARVLRVSTRYDAHIGFGKDAIAGDRFASSRLPVPEVIGHGRVGDITYCESRKVAGIPSDRLSLAEAHALAPAVARTLAAIWSTPPPVNSPGGWHVEGSDIVSGGENWRDVLGAAATSDWESGSISQVGRDAQSLRALKQVNTALLRLVDRIPDVEPRLVHGDFGFDNLMAGSKTVTGVIDWALSVIGDPAHDVAWLRFWELQMYGRNGRFSSLVEAQLPREFTASPGWNDRVDAAALAIAMNVTAWLAGAGRLEEMMATARRGASLATGLEVA
jgi:hygromycin-B 4-O-kinase